MMGTLGKGDKSAIQIKLLFKFYNNGFISTSNSEQEEQTNREKYVFYCSITNSHKSSKKNEKPHHNDCLNLPIQWKMRIRNFFKRLNTFMLPIFHNCRHIEMII